MVLLVLAKRATLGNFMPFREAPPAARGGGMLSDEDGVATERGLLAVAQRLGGGQPRCNEAPRMVADSFEAHFRDVGAILFGQLEAAPERRLRKCGEDALDLFHEIVHGMGRISAQAMRGKEKEPERVSVRALDTLQGSGTSHGWSIRGGPCSGAGRR